MMAEDPEKEPKSPLSPATTALAQRWKEEARQRREGASRESGQADPAASADAPVDDSGAPHEVPDADITEADGDVEAIDAVGTWEYLEKASEKLLEYLDKMAEAYSYSGQGAGLQNLNVRNAWNRCVKFKQAIRTRDLGASMEALDQVKKKLLDDELGPMTDELRREVDIFLRGFSYVRRELKQFKKDLDALSVADRSKVDEAVLEAKRAIDEEEGAGADGGEAAGNEGRGNPDGALVKLEALRTRLFLELSIARRVLVRKAARYGCVLPGRKHSLDFELGKGGIDAASEAKFKDIFAPDPPPQGPGFVIAYPPPRKRDSENFVAETARQIHAFRATTDARAAWRLYARGVDARLHEEGIARLRDDAAAEAFVAELRRDIRDPWARYTCDLYDEAAAATATTSMSWWRAI